MTRSSPLQETLGRGIVISILGNAPVNLRKLNKLYLSAIEPSGGCGSLLADRELRGEIMDMVQYLHSGMLRRRSGSMHRLTAVTILGLIGTTATGFLGMNLIAEADASMATKIAYFSASMLVFGVLTFIPWRYRGRSRCCSTG